MDSGLTKTGSLVLIQDRLDPSMGTDQCPSGDVVWTNQRWGRRTNLNLNYKERSERASSTRTGHRRTLPTGDRQASPG